VIYHQTYIFTKKLLKFVYTGDINVVNDGNVMELLHCSAIFGMDDLKNISERYISERLDEDNAHDCLKFASMLGLERLSREALDMIEFSKGEKMGTDGIHVVVSETKE
jgi:hypothetical protein